MVQRNLAQVQVALKMKVQYLFVCLLSVPGILKNIKLMVKFVESHKILFPLITKKIKKIDS